MVKHVIKFGGSVITEASSADLFNERNTRRLAREFFPNHHEGCVLVHGTGHVGKPPAIKHGYAESGILLPSQKLIALKIKNDIRQLNHRFNEVFLSESIPVTPFDILQFYDWTENGFNLQKIAQTINQQLDKGLVPVSFGDLLPAPDGSFKVISSDLISLLLSEALHPHNVIFLTDVKGVYLDPEKAISGSADGLMKVLDHEKLSHLKESKNYIRDVSGGMQSKAKLALMASGNCDTCFIGCGLAPGILSNLLAGADVTGTFVKSN